MINALIHWCLRHAFIVILGVLAAVGVGYYALTRTPVDAIPDIGEKQVIVFADWPGRSPQDVDNQVTYPLTTSLTGTPGVKTIRSMSGFGCARRLQFLDDRGVAVRHMIGKDLRTAGGPHILRREDVFHRDRNAVKRSAIQAARQFLAGAPRPRPRPLLRDGDERLELLLKPGDPPQRIVGEFRRRDFPGPQSGGRVLNGPHTAP